jgi:hypothetical protein
MQGVAARPPSRIANRPAAPRMAADGERAALCTGRPFSIGQRRCTILYPIATTEELPLLTRLTAAALVAAFALAGCAQAPEEVRAAYTSPVAYGGLSCRQLGEEQARLNGALAGASSQQNQTRSNDVAGWLLLGLPVGSMSGGNVAPEIANDKGQLGAVQHAMIKRCGR